METEIKNLGVKLGRRHSDYAGNALPYEVRNPSGDWRPFLVVGEIQRSIKEDWMDCVARSATNSIEIQEKQQTGKESNYCDREVALGSGTDRKGNWLYKVSDYIRHTGLGQQTTYPDSDGDWNEQYQPIPTKIKEQLALEKLEWKKKWDIKDVDIPFDEKSLKYHLKHAPIQVVIPGHAVVDVFNENDVDRIFDSYPPFQKVVPSHYYPSEIIFAKKIVLYKREEAIPDEWLLVDLRHSDTGKQVEKLLAALRKLGWGYRQTEDWPTVYDDKVANLVSKYKLANTCEGVWARFWERYVYRGISVDSETRENINNNLSKR